MYNTAYNYIIYMYTHVRQYKCQEIHAHVVKEASDPTLLEEDRLHCLLLFVHCIS